VRKAGDIMNGTIARTTTGADYELATRLHTELKALDVYIDLYEQIQNLEKAIGRINELLSDPLAPEELKELRTVLNFNIPDDLSYRLFVLEQKHSKKISDINCQLKVYRYFINRMPTDLDSEE